MKTGAVSGQILREMSARVITAGGEESIADPPAAPLYPTVVRDILDHGSAGPSRRSGVRDCLRVVRLIDQAYERAGRTSA